MTYKPPKILTGTLEPGESIADAYRRAEEQYDTLGEPGPALPWHQDDYGGWCRLLAGSDRIVAMVDEYEPDLGGGYFFCVGDGPAEESSDEHFASADAARTAADVRLKEMGYTFREAD